MRQRRSTCRWVPASERIRQAKAAQENLRRIPPEFVESRLKGLSMLRKPDDRDRQAVFMRIAAGLEDPSAADALR